ncbi:MAG: PilW family protein [Gammaproteobacteria bacterium]|nr:PilW family protein [Gammaproteobacteria bacterium]MDH3751160.1 PilW family protein [Gammaproteobacteria bacterium]MDH3804864.1 PilW family protein [Gammaproteobacteria bacterium]
MQVHSYNSQAGFSVVEIMIAMLLSLVMGAAIVTVFVNNSYSFNQDENIARMQDDARHALREIAFDISMAGHYAELHIPEAVTADGGLSIGIDCGPAGDLNWMYRTIEAATGNSMSIAAIDNASNSAAAAAHSCFQSGELLDGTDVVSIKRVAGAEAGALTAGTVYLRTNGTVGFLFNGPAPAAPPVAVGMPRADWQYRPSIYYIRRFANAPGDNIPTLCRKALRGTGPDMATECLATGIENLQIEYGVDTSEDGHPNVYMTNPSLTDMQSVVAARIFLVARTTEIDTRYTNNKTYSISNAPDMVPGDSFHRRVFSTSVSIQNIRSMNKMGF